MRLLEPVSEDEVIAAFLEAEADSPRFGPALVDELARDGADPKVVTAPALADPVANAYRRELLGRLRGWGRNEALFAGFPPDMRWYRAVLSGVDLARVRYIDWDYWVEFSGGSRLPADAVARLRSGASSDPTSYYEAIAAKIAAGQRLPKLIVVGDPGRDRLVVLEGHVRLTAMFFADLLPAELDVYFGTSERIWDWDLF